jgi:probable HAF family extracellular repeat protein
MKFARFCAAILLASLVTSAHARSTTPSVPVFHFVSYPGAMYSSLYAVSNNNIGVGVYYDSGFGMHGYMVVGGKFTVIDDPNGAAGSTSANGVNSSGTVVGSYAAADGNSQAFSYSKGVFTDIGPPGLQSIAYGINDLGQSAGTFQDTDTVWKGWIFNGSAYETVVVPQATNTVVNGISVHGIAVVEWTDASSHEESSIYNGTTFTTIDVPGAVDTYAEGIDSTGDVVLAWDRTVGTDYGALLTGKTFTKFNATGCVTSFGTGINDHRIVVGVCNRTNGFVGFYVNY